MTTKNNPKLHIRKNDMVLVLSGEEKGKKGRVLKIFVAENRAIVEGVHMVKKHLKANVDKNNPNGGIIQKEAPVHISNLMLVDSDGNATRVGRKMNENNKLQRVSKKSGNFIPEPTNS